MSCRSFCRTWSAAVLTHTHTHTPSTHSSVFTRLASPFNPYILIHDEYDVCALHSTPLYTPKQRHTHSHTLSLSLSWCFYVDVAYHPGCLPRSPLPLSPGRSDKSMKLIFRAQTLCFWYSKSSNSGGLGFLAKPGWRIFFSRSRTECTKAAF